MKTFTTTQTYQKVKEGVDGVADVVKVTLGPKGKNVIVSNPGDVSIINDGVSIARQIAFEDDEQKDAGAKLAIQCAEKTNKDAGDGTTTTLVLLQAYLNEHDRAQGDPRELRAEAESTLATVIEKIDGLKRECKDEDIIQIALNSSLDPEIAKAIKTVVKEEGVIEVEELDKFGIETEEVNGFRIADGLFHQQFSTTDDHMKAEMTDVPVLITRRDIVANSDLQPIIEELIKAGKKKLVIFCSSIEREVAGWLILNKLQGVFQTLLVKTGDMDDIATITGATIVTDEYGTDYKLENLGFAGKVLSDPYETTILEGGAKQSHIDAQIEEYKEKYKIDPSENLAKQIARLQGGISVIRIGGHNQQSTKERKLKLEDAINSVKAAMEDGVVSGGGTCLSLIAMDIENPLMQAVLHAPQKQLIENADGVISDSSGVIDPAKVIKCALTNAVATGNMILTAKAGVYYKHEKRSSAN
jgi:chaperonin GroEL